MSPSVNDTFCEPWDESTTVKDLDSIYGLWPNLQNKKDFSSGETLYGFRESIQIIWNHQHPPDCSKAKFMISNGWPGGFGSVAHVEGLTLAIAMELGRVLLPHPDGPVRGPPRDLGWHYDQGWHVDNTYCKEQNQTTMDCYFEPWSSCTIEDALRGRKIDSIPDIWLRQSERDWMRLVDNYTLPSRLRKLSARYRTVIYINLGISSSFVPKQLRSILDCSNMIPDFSYYWWRAISATYLIRPNARTLQEINKYALLPIDHSEERCLAMHIRRGDKGIEMDLIALEEYLSAATYLWEQKLIPQTRTQTQSQRLHAPVLFLGSDEPSLFAEVQSWGQKQGWKVIYTNLFDRSTVSAKLHWEVLLEHQFNHTVVHHDLEYMSILVNLHYALKCDAWVCTLQSNTCRLIDEMRATVGGKANRFYADLSRETCSKPPCIGGKGLKTVGW
eukprot:gene6284-12725_t